MTNTCDSSALFCIFSAYHNALVSVYGPSKTVYTIRFVCDRQMLHRTPLIGCVCMGALNGNKRRISVKQQEFIVIWFAGVPALKDIYSIIHIAFFFLLQSVTFIDSHSQYAFAFHNPLKLFACFIDIEYLCVRLSRKPYVRIVLCDVTDKLCARKWFFGRQSSDSLTFAA